MERAPSVITDGSQKVELSGFYLPVLTKVAESKFTESARWVFASGTTNNLFLLV